MSNSIERPIFNDGQILNASDLGASVDYARDQLARHERYLHSWGIAFGYELNKATKTDSQQNNYVEVTVKAGLAVDGRGREVVLTSDTVLDPTTFSTAHVFDPARPNAWYPVYVRGLLPTPVTSASLTGACGGANQATRETEDVQFVFQAPDPPDNSTGPYSTPGPADPTDPPNSAKPWDILIGFVQWDGSSKFKDAAPVDDNGVRRRIAGVQAERVEARDGSLTLQTGGNPATRLKLVLAEAGTNPGSMTFGADDGHGGVTNLFQITDKGDLTISGKFQSGTSLPPGAVSIQSGVVTDGVILPLPAGVSEDDVSNGSVVLHIQVVPVVPDVTVPVPGTPPFAITPIVCFVDSDRRVNCLVRSLTIAAGPKITTIDSPGICQYLLIAAKPAAGEGSS